MSDYDVNSIDDWSPLSSPSIRDVLPTLDRNNNGQNPMSETFAQTNSFTDPQSEKRSGGLRDRMAARLGFNIPSLEIESARPFANYFRNPFIVPSPILVISPGFSVSPLLQSPNILSSSSQITPSCPIPSDGPMETVKISGGTHTAMIISNNNLPNQSMDVDLHPQGGSDDIPMEEYVYVTSHESNHDLIGASVAPFDSDVVAETGAMNLISLKSGGKDNDKNIEYNKEGDNAEDHNIVVEPSSRKRRKNVVWNMIGVPRQNKSERVTIQVESKEDHLDDGFHWRKYGQRVVIGNANPRRYYRCKYTGCQVKKFVQRSAYNVKLVVLTYDGKHEHAPPPESDPSNQTLGLGMLRSSVSAPQLFPSPLAPQLDMMQHYMDGLSKLPSLPINQNHGFMNLDDETNTDHVISDGTELYKAIREQLFLYFGFNPYGKP